MEQPFTHFALGFRARPAAWLFRCGLSCQLRLLVPRLLHHLRAWMLLSLMRAWSTTIIVGIVRSRGLLLVWILTLESFSTDQVLLLLQLLRLGGRGRARRVTYLEWLPLHLRIVEFVLNFDVGHTVDAKGPSNTSLLLPL